MNAWTLFGNGSLSKAGTKESVIAHIEGESEFFFECCGGRRAEEIQNTAAQLYFWCCSPDD